MIRGLLLLAFILLFMLIRGASLDVFWDWFIAGQYAPFFEAAPDITLIQALGMSVIIGFFTGNWLSKMAKTDDETEKPTSVLGYTLGGYVGLWLVAIFIHLLMK